MDTHPTPESRLAAVSAADYEIVSIDRSTALVGATTFGVETINYSGGSRETHLIGPRGARYLVRPYLGEDTGLRQVISLGSGQPLRVRGNEVRVLQIGDIIEMALPQPVRGLR